MMQYVNTESALLEAAERIGSATLFAADTEAAGFHRFRDRICLLQISTREETFVLDTLALDRLQPLEAGFASPDVEVVFHDAEYDLRLLARDLGISVRGLFDTKVAAQFLGEPAIGLASLLERHLGVHLEKKYQRADWAQRPLSAPLLEYAAMDTRYLPALRDILRDALEARDRLRWAEEEFRLHEVVEANAGEAPAEEAYLRVKGTRDLRPRQLAALRELFQWREEIGRIRDVAAFRIASNEALVELARHLPDSVRAAMALPTVPNSLVAKHGSELLERIRRARALPESELPQRRVSGSRRLPDPEFEALVDRLKAARDEAARETGLDRGFLLPCHQLEEIARHRPASMEDLTRVPGIRRWQVEAAGERILDVLGRAP